MSIIKNLLVWVMQKTVRWHCRRNGHSGNITTLEIYNEQIRVKNYRTIGGRIFFTHPYKEQVVCGKHRCKDCDTVFIGFIVKGEAPCNIWYDA